MTSHSQIPLVMINLVGNLWLWNLDKLRSDLILSLRIFHSIFNILYPSNSIKVQTHWRLCDVFSHIQFPNGLNGELPWGLAWIISLLPWPNFVNFCLPTNTFYNLIFQRKKTKKALCTTIVVHESSLVSWPLAMAMVSFPIPIPKSFNELVIQKPPLKAYNIIRIRFALNGK